MNTSYISETIARQQMAANAQHARTAHQRHPVRATTARWTFPKFSFGRRAGAVAQRTA